MEPTERDAGEGHDAEVYRVVARLLNEALRASGVSQRRLAELCGLRREYVGQVLRGQAKPSFSVVVTMFEKAGVPLAAAGDELMRTFSSTRAPPKANDEA